MGFLGWRVKSMVVKVKSQKSINFKF